MPSDGRRMSVWHRVTVWQRVEGWQKAQIDVEVDDPIEAVNRAHAMVDRGGGTFLVDKGYTEFTTERWLTEVERKED